MFQFLNNKYARWLTVVLLLQIGLFYGASKYERTPANVPLAGFPADIMGWHMVTNAPIDAEVQKVLRADDTMNRVYANTDRTSAVSLFAAYFQSQRRNQTPHSPKNCLPGAGWEPSATGTIDVDIPSEGRRIRINNFVVSRGDEKSIVLYWYQSRDRVIASEYAAKFWLVMDSIRYRRSDTAMVREVVPVTRRDLESASHMGIQFVQTIFPVLRHYLPA
jgi:EpsI family protein